MTTQYLWARIAGSDPDLRAADADRERAAERLRRGHAEGRLDLAEFQQRLERCYDAKTFGELRELVRDLPRHDEPQERRPIGTLGSWSWRLAPLLIVLLVISSAAAGHAHFFWLWVPFWFFIWRMWWWPRRRRYAAHHRGPDDLI